ncbi:hypothetical protein [Aquimarina aggregata]|uniref:hypothetical protein n=1 Tax=Aquimarina aggregata TaxID=1642818 RepID=UPI0024919C32|nr:hypothetical protein [Aquimarina aggregata]
MKKSHILIVFIISLSYFSCDKENTVEDDYSSNYQADLLDEKTIVHFDFDNFTENLILKSNNGERVFNSGNATIIIPSGSCPPPILDPAEVCINGQGGSNGGCGNKTAQFKHPTQTTAQGEIKVSIKVEDNKFSVTTRWTGDSEYEATFTQDSADINKISQDGTRRIDVTGTLKTRSSTGISIGPFDTGSDTTRDREIAISIVYNPCGNNGAGSGGILLYLVEP